MGSALGSEQIYYNSIYRHGVDEKRRLQIPAKWRPGNEDFRLTMFLWPNGHLSEACLLVLPPQQMQTLIQRLQQMSYGDAQASALRRILGSKSEDVILDKNGRICIPETMARATAIDKEAVLVGLLDRFEIWNPERYEAARSVDEALLPEAFKLI